MPLLQRSIETLSGFGAFTRVITLGKKYESSPIKAFVCSSPSDHIKLRIGFAVTRGIRKAVQRNMLKRLMKEAVRLRRKDFLSHIDSGMLLEIVFLYNNDIKKLSKKVKFASINQATANLISIINAAYPQAKT